jgi:ABC-type multidrug transport system fused ATPase/permease subunit
VTAATRAILMAALRRRPYQLVRLAVWSAAEAAPAFVIGHAMARAIDAGFAAGRPDVGLGWLAVLGATWLVAAFGARQVILALATIVEPFRDELITHVVDDTLHRAATVAGPRPDTAAVARLNLQVEVARDAFAAVIMVLRSFGFTVFSVVLGMLTLSPQMLVIALPPFVAGLGIFLMSLPAMARRQRAYFLADERTAESVTTTVGALRDIAACGAEDRIGTAVSRQITAQAAIGVALAKVTAVRTLSMAVGGWLPILLILAATPWLLSHGASAGIVIGSLAYVMQSLIPALDSLIQGLGVSAVRLAVTMDRILEQRGDARPAAAATQTPLGCYVELNGVTFAYGPHAEPVIADLHLIIPEGEHLAVVGPSGIGKSTLAALITGILTPNAGEVAVGGVRADLVNPAARVLIPQEAYVFRGSLMENLTYLTEVPSKVPEAAVDKAVAAVGMISLVRRLGGYSAEVEPVTLSAGERQLIALARAYLAPARLIILDEATCHLDPAAEARAEMAFARRGGTLIVVAHRVSSALRARRVLLMDGTRVRLGSHGELVHTAPLYADLVGRWHPEPVLAS